MCGEVAGVVGRKGGKSVRESVCHIGMVTHHQDLTTKHTTREKRTTERTQHIHIDMQHHEHGMVGRGQTNTIVEYKRHGHWSIQREWRGDAKEREAAHEGECLGERIVRQVVGKGSVSPVLWGQAREADPMCVRAGKAGGSGKAQCCSRRAQPCCMPWAAACLLSHRYAAGTACVQYLPSGPPRSNKRYMPRWR